MRGTGPRRPWLYDPSLGGVLVRAHRPPAAGAASSVVSDVVWGDVLGVLRWAEATLTCPLELCGDEGARLVRATQGGAAQQGRAGHGYSFAGQWSNGCMLQ